LNLRKGLSAEEGIMAEENELFIRPELKSPRSAAIAGILFSLLLMTSMLLFRSIVTVTPADIDRDWIESSAKTASLALALVPFAGIAFLWFTGVIRDRLGGREDKLFATVFFGSGILLVGMIFVWAAAFGAVFGTYALAADRLVDDDIFFFGITFMNEILGNYTLRMAGVFMLSIGTLWTRTGIMPRWLTIITYIVALGFIVFAGTIREARFIFPAWVFLVSVYILVMNYRRTHDQEPEAR
jgi:hypothetical protein